MSSLGGCAALERTDFRQFPHCDGVHVRTNLRFLLIWLCHLMTNGIVNCCLSVCYVCISIDYHTGQCFWLKWLIANSPNAVRFHCQCWHHGLMCTALLILWLMPVGLCFAYILTYFPHSCTLGNLGMWHFRCIFIVRLYMVIPG